MTGILQCADFCIRPNMPYVQCPVCGSNGQTYDSICELQCDACQKGQEIIQVSDGTCPEPSEHCFEGNMCTDDSYCGNAGKCEYQLFGPGYNISKIVIFILILAYNLLRSSFSIY